MKRFAPFARTSTLALLALTACGGNEAAPGSGPGSSVGTVHSIAGAYQLGEDSQRGVQRMQTGAELSVGEGARASLEHDAGPWILLDASTSVSADLESVTLQSGKLFIDARRGALRVATTGGEIRAEGATFAVEGNTVYCASGELTWTAEGGESGLLAQGESLAFDGSPEASAAGLWDDWTGGLADPAPWHLPESSYVGSLLGRRPNELGKARRPISVRAHEVDVAIRGDFAVTTVTQTFFNAESETLEAHYAMRLPEGAIVSSFAADMGNGFMNASVTPLEWNVNPYYAPSEQRLAYDGEGRVRARVSPIGPGDTVRLRTTYAHWMDRRGDTRTYVYPMVDAGSQPPLVGEFRLTVDTSGNRITATRAGMGAEVEDGRVVLRRSDYRPTADFHLDLIEAGSANDDAVAYIVTAPAYEAGLSDVAADGDERFVLVDVPTSALNGWDEGEEEGGVAPLDLALVVDVSGGTAPEDLELARAVVESTLRQLAPEDRVSLQVGDVRAHPPEGLDGTFLPATPENAERLLEALASVPLGGATDLGAMLRDASELVADAPRGAVLYVGDGTATTGQLDATAIGARLATVEGAPRIFALALGEASGTDLLRRITDRTEAVSLRTDAARAIMRILADATRPTLRGATVDFGETVERVYPSMPTTLTLDHPLRFVGRLRGDMPSAIVLRGRRAGEDVERTINVRNGTVQDDGDIRRRWASSRLLELVDQDAGREALVSLGMRYDLLTPWTSLSAGMGKGVPYSPVVTFDRDPVESAIVAPAARTGWRRRERTPERSTRVAAESTWTPRVRPDVTSAGSGDGGLGREAVRRTLESSERGPRACYERRLITRPDLSGMVRVSVTVDGDGAVQDAKLDGQSLGEADVAACVVTEVSGLRFPATGGSRVTVSYRYDLSPQAAIGVRRSCSDASRQGLTTRRALWRERLAASAGATGAVAVWNQARAQCELPSWSSKRALLDLMIASVSSLDSLVSLHRGLRGDGSARAHLRRAILRRVHTPQQVQYVRRALGLEADVDWDYFSARWNRGDDAARLALVRRWLEVLGDELDLRIREIALLESLGRIPEARRRARELRAHPLADAAAYAAVGEFFLRQGDEDEAKRIFSELVEGTPYDPWARRRLGDLYRVHGWYDDSYREYESLSRISPADRDVLLLLARAAAGAGRVDEALRLEERLAEGRAAGSFGGTAGIAQLWSLTRLIDLQLDGGASENDLRERMRSTGLLRNPAAAVLMMTWAHPESTPELFVNVPSTPVGVDYERAEVQGGPLGMDAQIVEELDEGDAIRLEVRRPAGALRDFEGTLHVALNLGTENQRFLRVPVRIARGSDKARFTLRGDALEPTS